MTLERWSVDGKLSHATVLATSGTAVVAYGATADHIVVLLEKRAPHSYAPLAWRVVVLSPSGVVVKEKTLDIKVGTKPVGSSVRATKDGGLMMLSLTTQQAPSVPPTKRLLHIAWDGKILSIHEGNPGDAVSYLARLQSGDVAGVSNHTAPSGFGSWLVLRRFDARGVLQGEPTPLELPKGVVNLSDAHVQIDDDGVLITGTSKPSLNSTIEAFVSLHRLDGSVVDAHIFKKSAPAWPIWASRQGRKASVVLQITEADGVSCAKGLYTTWCSESYRVDLRCKSAQ